MKKDTEDTIVAILGLLGIGGIATGAVFLGCLAALLLFALSIGFWTLTTYAGWWLISAAFGIQGPTWIGSLAIGFCLSIISRLITGSRNVVKVETKEDSEKKDS